MTIRAQWTMVGLTVVALISLLLVGATLAGEGNLIGPGRLAPSFKAVDVASGAAVSLEDYQGKVVLLNIWATWCKPCEEEMPSLQRLSQALESYEFEVVAVSIDIGDSEHVRDWVQARNLTFDVLHDPDGQIEKIYRTTGVPETFVIDQEGIIVKRQIGAAEWDTPGQAAAVLWLLGLDSLPPVLERS